MAQMEWVTESEEETRAVGEALGRRLGPGDVVCLAGPLGAGKTTLAQGIARGLGVEEVVNSPTFTLAQEYGGRLPVYHLDVYRLSGPEEAADLALNEMFEAGGVVMIEWPERIAPLLPADRLEICLERQGDARRLTASAHGARAAAILAALKK
jgi:tRNA threonylcarbamoyladenosine biosynthesis protein TsaE